MPGQGKHWVGLGPAERTFRQKKVGQGGLDGKGGGGVVRAWWVATVLPVAGCDGGKGVGSLQKGNGIGSNLRAFYSSWRKAFQTR